MVIIPCRVHFPQKGYQYSKTNANNLLLIAIKEGKDQNTLFLSVSRTFVSDRCLQDCDSADCSIPANIRIVVTER